VEFLLSGTPPAGNNHHDIIFEAKGQEKAMVLNSCGILSEHDNNPQLKPADQPFAGILLGQDRPDNSFWKPLRMIRFEACCCRF
jgi:hypothetical protein